MSWAAEVSGQRRKMKRKVRRYVAAVFNLYRFQDNAVQSSNNDLKQVVLLITIAKLTYFWNFPK